MKKICPQSSEKLVSVVSPYILLATYLVDDSALSFPQREAVCCLGQHPGRSGQQTRHSRLATDVVADAQQSLGLAETAVAEANGCSKGELKI